jgi:hypothetical protein
MKNDFESLVLAKASARRTVHRDLADCLTSKMPLDQNGLLRRSRTKSTTTLSQKTNLTWMPSESGKRVPLSDSGFGQLPIRCGA